MNTVPPTRMEVLNLAAEAFKKARRFNGESNPESDAKTTKSPEEPNELIAIVKRIECEGGWKMRGVIETFIDNERKHAAVETEVKQDGPDAQVYWQSSILFEALSDMCRQLYDPKYKEFIKAYFYESPAKEHA